MKNTIKKEGFIVVNSPSQYADYNWTMRDSLDGILYDTVESAMKFMTDNDAGVGIQKITVNIESDSQ